MFQKLPVDGFKRKNMYLNLMKSSSNELMMEIVIKDNFLK